MDDESDIVTQRSLMSARTTNSIQTSLTTRSMLPSSTSYGETFNDAMDHASYSTHWYEDVAKWRPRGAIENISSILYEESGFRREDKQEITHYDGKLAFIYIYNIYIFY